MSIHETMESKLQKAKAWQEYFEREGVPPEEEPAEPPTVPAKRKRAEDSELPRGISSVHVKRKRRLGRGLWSEFLSQGQVLSEAVRIQQADDGR